MRTGVARRFASSCGTTRLQCYLTVEAINIEIFSQFSNHHDIGCLTIVFHFSGAVRRMSLKYIS